MMLPWPRLVLDTSVFRGATPDNLAALAATGARISVARGALNELWRASTRDGKPGLLFQRVAKLAPLVDPMIPVTPGGRELTQLIVANADERPSCMEHLAELRHVWEGLVEGRCSYDEWRRVGADIEQFYARDTVAATMNAMTRPAGDRSFEATFEFARRNLGPRRLSNGRRPPKLFGTRCDALDRVLALRATLHAINPKSQPRREDNDTEDARMLHQVALPAVLVIDDAELVRDVRKSGSYQTAWVRTLEQVRRFGIPDGLPWGPKAKRQSQRWSDIIEALE